MLEEWNEPFRPRRFLLWTAALALAASLWLLSSGSGDGLRRGLLALCSLLLTARVLVPELRLYDRWRAWGPVLSTAGGLLAYQLGLAVLGAVAAPPIAGPTDAAGLASILAGTGLGAAAFRGCARRGRGLLVGRLLRQVRHPGYLGDVLCGIGAALLTRSPAAALIPVLHVAFLIAVAIPGLEWRRQLRHARRGDRRPRARHLVPFVY